MLSESEQDTLFKLISGTNNNGSLQKLEEVVQVVETELLVELNEEGGVSKKDEDLVFNAAVICPQ